MRAFADFEAIKVGDRQQLVKIIAESDIRKFVEMTGDDNPLHVDRKFAEGTAFKDVVVHGMLGASFISTVIGTKLPGPGSLWLTQQLEFLLPVRLGDQLTVSCTVLKKQERERLLELETRIVNQNGQVVLLGTGTVKVLKAVTPEDGEGTAERLHGAIVTGGAGGIGRAICIRLAQAGFGVVVNYRKESERAMEIVRDIETAGGEAIAIQADIATAEGVATLHSEAIRRFGGVGVVVNNASPRINPKPFSGMVWEDLQRHLDVQLKGAFLLTQACLPEMAARRFGRIVNITSQVLEGSPSPTWTSYAVAKSALAMMSRYAAAEFGPSGITVNCVAPGMTETSLIGDIPEKLQLLVARQTPLRRLARPADVAAAVAFLVSDEGAFITGQTISVNGGISRS